MKVLEQRQEFIKGITAGFVAAVGMYIFVEFFRWIGLTKFGVGFIAGSTVFTYKNNLLMNIIAFFVHCGFEMFWGIIYYFIFTRVFSKDYYLLKVIFISFLIYFFHYGFLDDVFQYDREIHKKTLDLLVILSGYLIYGLILAAFLKKQIIDK